MRDIALLSFCSRDLSGLNIFLPLLDNESINHTRPSFVTLGQKTDTEPKRPQTTYQISFQRQIYLYKFHHISEFQRVLQTFQFRRPGSVDVKIFFFIAQKNPLQRNTDETNYIY